MSTRLVFEMEYDAPLDAVAAMLSDRAFREEVCTNQRATAFQVSIDGDISAKEVRIEMTQPTDRVPAFAKKFIGATTDIVQGETWSSPAQADVTIEIPGKPGEVRGTAVLVEADGVTTETVTLDVKVKIPLVAGKLEELLAKIVRSALKAEYRTGQAWLGR